MNAVSDEDLLQVWRTTEDMTIRDQILEQMKERFLFPQDDMDMMEEDAGLYPDKDDDPMFLQKLLQKQEFGENKQLSVKDSIELGLDPCQGSRGFELSPTQRFIGQFLAPTTPYMSALLFHGVGVGKTCSAITVAEGYLEMYPRKKVMVIAPRNIQPNFSREIFSEAKLKMGTDDEPNEYLGCTGQTYLRLTGTEFSRDKASITNRVDAMKRKRYDLAGYLAFYNTVRKLLDTEVSKALTGDARLQKETAVLRKHFSNRLIIIDEAHNIRDLSEAEEENTDAPGGRGELSESLAGKKLTPYLRKILMAAEGVKLLLLTATPMYNSYKEIIPLLNLLLLNDKKATVSEADFFTPKGTFLPRGDERFGLLLQGYVSFMRGENPLAFPIRLSPDPETVDGLSSWPSTDPLGAPIVDQTVRTKILNLPFVPVYHSEEGLTQYRSLVGRLIVRSGLRLGATDGLVQAGNFLFPGGTGAPPETRIREQGFKTCFTELKDPRQYKATTAVPSTWLHEDEIQAYSPKCAFVLKRLRTTQGITFIYSRFVYSGALAIALALEANGYENAGRSTGYLKDPVLAPGGKQCALCPKKQDDHSDADHPFRQAKYVLLTGNDEISPNNKASIDLSTRYSNKDGGDVKVVIGSQVASEGIDLKCIREILVYDSWFHLNKLEQVIGRGIRYCSHAALPKEKRNCTVLLLLTAFPSSQNQETIDEYQYRIGFEKAAQIGLVTRVMKKYALDCNLNKDAVLLKGLKPISMIDSQGEQRDSVEINDVGYTSVCDWIETCDYECAIPVKIDASRLNTSTYTEAAARWRAQSIKEALRAIFETEKIPFITHPTLLNYFKEQGVPDIAMNAILSQIVNNRSFRITVNNESGYILYKNGFYLFQPERLKDTGVPLALRTGYFPVKQDSYEEFEDPAQSRPALTATVGPGEGPAPVAEAPQDTESILSFWKALRSLARSVETGTLLQESGQKLLPVAVESALKRRYTGNKKAFDRAYNSLSMISRLTTDLQDTPSFRETFSYAVGKFLWDEFLTGEEQYTLYESLKSSNDALLFSIWEEHLVQFEDEVLYRRVNPSTGTLEYLCEGKACSPALVAAVEAEDETTDPLRMLRANATTTGNPYGTLPYKAGLFVFKTNVPVKPSPTPAIREKQERGSECAIVPNMPQHYEKLEALGRIAEASSLHRNLGLTLAEMKDAKAPRSVKNSVRTCALTDLVLRFFDELGLQDKRWFYRPLATFFTKHPGIVEKKA